jgi:hypothetical protein
VLFLAPAIVVSLTVLFEFDSGAISTCALIFKVAVDKNMKEIRIHEVDAHNLSETGIS